MLEESHIAITKGIVQSMEEVISVATVSGVLAELTGLRPQHRGAERDCAKPPLSLEETESLWHNEQLFE